MFVVPRNNKRFFKGILYCVGERVCLSRGNEFVGMKSDLNFIEFSLHFSVYFASAQTGQVRAQNFGKSSNGSTKFLAQVSSPENGGE